MFSVLLIIFRLLMIALLIRCGYLLCIAGKWEDVAHPTMGQLLIINSVIMILLGLSFFI